MIRHGAGGLGVAIALLVGCGAPAKPTGDGRGPAGARIERDIDPADIFPADLDLVLRIDVGRMRDGIGPAAADALAKRALADGGDEEIREALACAEVVWVGTRLADAGAGDRVIVVEGKSCVPALATVRWERKRSGNGRVRIFDRTDEAPRTGTQRILNLGNRATVFISPVELDAVKRVMESGPDPKRGAPAAEGIVSFDQRAGRLSPALEKKYPSIGAVLAGIERIRGSAVLVDEGLRIDAQVLGVSPASAGRAAQFFTAMRDSLAKSTRFGAAFKDAKVDLADKAIQLHVTVPAKVILALANGSPTDEPTSSVPPAP